MVKLNLIYKGNSVVSVCDRVVCSAQPCHRFYGRIGWAVQGVTSTSCPWQQKEKETLPIPCVTFSSCPWQQKEKKHCPFSV